MSTEKESFGYDEMFDDGSFVARFHTMRSRARPTRDLMKSFRSSGFQDAPHETMSFDDGREQASNFYVRRPETAMFRDNMPGSVSKARFMTKYSNESFLDDEDVRSSNYIATRSQSFAGQHQISKSGRGVSWQSFSAN